MVTGTTAFSGVEARRSSTVKIVPDDEAYLKLQPGDSNFASYSDGRLVIEFDDEFEDCSIDDENLGGGLGTGSTYHFDDVFVVKNQGTETVSIFGDYDDDALEGIALYEADDRSLLSSEDSASKPLNPGEDTSIGVRIDTPDDEEGTVETSIKINATEKAASNS